MTTTTLAGTIIGFGLGWLLMEWIRKKSNKRPPQIPNSTYHEDEMTDELETDTVYDNADGETLFAAKLRCLEMAREDMETVEPTKVIETAKLYWDFLVFDERSSL